MNAAELPITGYLDRFSHRPGEAFVTHVSLREAGPYRARLVRVISGDPNPAGPGMRFEDLSRVFDGKPRRQTPGHPPRLIRPRRTRAGARPEPSFHPDRACPASCRAACRRAAEGRPCDGRRRGRGRVVDRAARRSRRAYTARKALERIAALRRDADEAEANGIACGSASIRLSGRVVLGQQALDPGHRPSS